MILDLQNNDDIGLIVFDSVKALVPEIEYENDFDKGWELYTQELY